MIKLLDFLRQTAFAHKIGLESACGGKAFPQRQIARSLSTAGDPSSAFVSNLRRYKKQIVCPTSLINLRSIAELITVPIRSSRLFEIERY
jgi:hypothetical protein